MQRNTNYAEDRDPRATASQGVSLVHNHASVSSAPAKHSTAGAAGSFQVAEPTPATPQTYGLSERGIDPRLQARPHLGASTSVPSALNTMQRGASPPSDDPGPHSVSTIAAGMAAQSILAHDPEDDSTIDGRKAKRELSQSKRAAQNRAAQRAFRQRKEHYIKKLEQQVREYAEMEHSFKAIQNDNYALREYVIQLQSRLLDLQVELPQPPPNVNITPPTAPSAPAPAPSAPSAHRTLHHSAAVEPGPSSSSAGTLADVAAAVAGLRARDASADGNYQKQFKNDPSTEEARTADDIRRQLQDTLPPPSSLRA